MHNSILNIYDVIIAGGGPAGASAAYVLVKAGKKVLVLEKEKLPRYKTCGGGLTFRGLNLIPFDVSKVVEKKCFAAEINDFEANIAIVTKREMPIISMTMRSELDYLLIKEAEKLGAEIKDDKELKDINYIENNIEVTLKNNDEKFYSKFLIAADGTLSVAMKKYFGEYKRKLIPALEYEIYADDDTQTYFENSARFDFGVVPNGYGWVFPKKDHLSIGVLSMKLKDGNLNNYFAEYMRLLGINKIRKSERHGFIVPLTLGNNFAKNRVLLIGDAAGLIDPITAEGISYAIQSGRLAAESILKKNFIPELVCKEYNYQISKEILPELRTGRILTSFVYGYRWLRIWIVRLYGKKLSELITDVVMGEKKYSNLVRNPLNYFKLLYRWSIKNMQKQKLQKDITTFQTGS